MAEKQSWTRQDLVQVTLLALVTVSFSVREGPFWEAALHSFRYLVAYCLYGLVTVLVFVGLTKKIWKYNPTRVQMVKWAVAMAAFFAVNQLIHEAFLALTGQGPR